MSNTEAHLADRVLPSAPVRQWELSLPFELPRIAAPRFHDSGAPTEEEIAHIVRCGRGRSVRWLEEHGRLDTSGWHHPSVQGYA